MLIIDYTNRESIYTYTVYIYIFACVIHKIQHKAHIMTTANHDDKKLSSRWALVFAWLGLHEFKFRIWIRISFFLNIKIQFIFFDICKFFCFKYATDIAILFFNVFLPAHCQQAANRNWNLHTLHLSNFSQRRTVLIQTVGIRPSAASQVGPICSIRSNAMRATLLNQHIRKERKQLNVCWCISIIIIIIDLHVCLHSLHKSVPSCKAYIQSQSQNFAS